ncbi:glycosyltransferase [Clostridium sp. DSM 100503]|uniref:glycosyltransferase n=1 Tax=Clostridium sp. DSM 100503 TaxID=2963282 RepID=UPI00214A6F9C|nr:glycosyltransferase [Clostridium sp. DSM 100503]MCR1951310.1 glycosyltransferase [Clostridium sp. DSM 100503]
MKKVIFFITGLDIGGAEIQVYRICKYIDKSDLDIKLISLTDNGKIGQMLKQENIEVFCFNIKKNKIKGIINIFRFVRKENPDVVIGFLFHAIIISRVIGWLNSVPNIISSIRSFNTGGVFRETLLKITDYMSNTTIVNSYIVYDEVLSKRIVKKEKLKVIRNAIDTEHFKFNKEYRHTWRKKINVDNNTFVWMAVGRLVYEKDYITMIKAFKKVLEQDENVILYIVGDGYMKNEINDLIAKYGLSNNIIINNKSEEINKLLCACDGVVLTSRWEGIPNIIIEAIALNRIVVATNVGGVSEVIKNENFLVESENVDSVVKGMIEAKKEWEVLGGEEFGLKSRKRIEEDYDVRNIVVKWKEVINADYKK